MRGPTTAPSFNKKSRPDVRRLHTLIIKRSLPQEKYLLFKTLFESDIMFFQFPEHGVINLRHHGYM